ncbi:MAG: murein hydrolase activator EnvC [Acuticoccus sp.]
MLLASALVLACVPAARAQDDGPTREESLAHEREQLTARLARLRDETAATEARAEVLGETLVDLAGDEARLRQRLDATAARIAELERGIAGDEAALDRLTGGQAAIRHELAARRRELATVLMALQRIGRRPPPALFVGKGGPTGVVRGAILLNAVIPTLDSEAQALARQMAEAARLAADEELRWQSLRGDLAELTNERERLNALVAELSRRRALSLYERDQASANLARLAAEASSVNALLSRLEEGTRDSGAPQGLAFASRRGGLPDPVAGAVIGEFGDRTEADGLSEGRIIAALPQSTVFAPMPATVLYAAPFRSYAHVLILDAGDGYHMVLTGLEESFVEAGSTVEAGTPIGRMGARRGRSAVVPVQNSRGSLTAERPLLYVELRRDGAAIDSHGWWRNPIPDGGRTSG